MVRQTNGKQKNEKTTKSVMLYESAVKKSSTCLAAIARDEKEKHLGPVAAGLGKNTFV